MPLFFWVCRYFSHHGRYFDHYSYQQISQSLFQIRKKKSSYPFIFLLILHLLKSSPDTFKCVGTETSKNCGWPWLSKCKKGTLLKEIIWRLSKQWLKFNLFRLEWRLLIALERRQLRMSEQEELIVPQEFKGKDFNKSSL